MVTKKTRKAAAKGAARFSTTLNQADGKNATGVIIPDTVIEKLGAGERSQVRVTINGHEYQTTVGVSAAIRKETGLEAGIRTIVRIRHPPRPRADPSPPSRQAD